MKYKSFLLLLVFLFSIDVFSQTPDINLLRTLNSPQSLSSDGFFRFVSGSYGYIVLGTPVALGAAGFIRQDDLMKKKALVIAEALILDVCITQAIKYSVDRERPFLRYPDITQKTNVHDPSFPSGHTSAAFAIATSLSLSYPKWYVIVPSLTWAGSVGYSRMHLGVHYPSDVLCGALTGVGCALLTQFVNKKLNQRVPVKKNHYNN